MENTKGRQSHRNPVDSFVNYGGVWENISTYSHFVIHLVSNCTNINLCTSIRTTKKNNKK